MKFGANLKKIISLSDPEWGPYWMNYHQVRTCLWPSLIFALASDIQPLTS